MKVLIISVGLFFVLVLILVGCKSISNVKYGVQFNNIGDRDIIVSDIVLYDSKEFSRAGCGELLAGGKASSGKYYQQPNTEYNIHWKDLKTNQQANTKIKINPPKLFYNKSNGANIILYIKPETKKIYVAYEVFDPNKQDFTIVDSAGRVFDIKKIKK